MSGVPDAWFDGVVRELGGISGGNMFSYYQTHVNNRLGVSSPLAIGLSWKLESATTGTLSVDIDVAAPVTTTSNIVHFVIVEEGLSTYGVTPGLARDMLTDETFTLTTPGESVHYAKPFTISPSWDLNNIGFVVFVQSHSTPKEVLQAARSGPAGDRMDVTPLADFESAGPQGGPFSPTSVDYVVENLGEEPIEYSVTTDAEWLSVLNGAGTLGAHASETVTVELSSLAPALGTGIHRASIQFTNLTNALGSTSRDASLEIGDRVLVYSYTLDTNPGWSLQTLWAWGQPTGQGGQNGYPDPTSGHTGDNCYGYNLSGDYTNYMTEKYLRTPYRSFTNYSGVQLRFWRWLGVGDPSGDHAYVRASRDGATWTDVWTNATAVADSQWVQQVCDLSSFADGYGVFVRFIMGATDASGQYCGWNVDDIEFWAIPNGQSSVPDEGASAKLHLLPSRPNPFRDAATIAFELPATDVVRVAVYDVAGRLVQEVANTTLEAGQRTVRWDGTDADGSPVASGVYFCTVESGGASATQKLVVLR